ncbi:hypothetical protein D3C86_1109970 [compost metagenome]
MQLRFLRAKTMSYLLFDKSGPCPRSLCIGALADIDRGDGSRDVLAGRLQAALAASSLSPM